VHKLASINRIQILNSYELNILKTEGIPRNTKKANR